MYNRPASAQTEAPAFSSCNTCSSVDGEMSLSSSGKISIKLGSVAVDVMGMMSDGGTYSDPSSGMVLLCFLSAPLPPLCSTVWTSSVLSWWRRETRCGGCHGGCCRTILHVCVCLCICLSVCLCFCVRVSECDFIDTSGSQTDAKDLLHHQKFITHAHCSKTTTMTISVSETSIISLTNGPC